MRPRSRSRATTRDTPRAAPRAAPRAEPDVFAAIADPTRRRLLEILREEGEQPVHALAERFDATRPAISQHLRVLREADLVREARAGRERRYRLHAAALREAHAWIARYEAFWDDRLARLGAALDRAAPDRAAPNAPARTRRRGTP